MSKPCFRILPATLLLLVLATNAWSAKYLSEPHRGMDLGRRGDKWRDVGQTIEIPIEDEQGKVWKLHGRLCRPSGVDRPRLVVINHGSPANADARPGMTADTCDSEAVQWFLHRHYAVALVLRLGYGATGGPWTEGYGGCDEADYYRSGLETARQIGAIVDAVTTLPTIDPNGVVVVGQSAGGWGTLAYDSIAHPKVVAFIDMAGGRGGHFHDKPDSNCHPEKLVEAAAKFGKTATTPMLWVYAKNDSFFNPDLAAAMYKAFDRAGGRAEFVAAESFASEGHHLFAGHEGSKVWGPLVEAYLARFDSSSAP